MLVLATSNPGKIAEIESLLQPFNLPVKSAKELGFNEEVEESGRTFEENAAIKALAIAKALNLPALADDSGLCVASLNGAPGVLSARFAGQNANDEKNNQALVAAMQGVKNREAYFACCMVCAKPDGGTLISHGRLNGIIANAPQGTNGFGYDPLFILPESGLTLAQMDKAAKNAISHRGRALRELLAKLPGFISPCQGVIS